MGTIRSFNHFQCAIRETVAGKFPLGDPGGAAHVIAGRERAAGDTANVIGEHVVILGPALGVGHNALEDLEELHRFDRKAGFFAHFADDGAGERFAGFDGAARQRPPTLERFAAAFNEEQPVPVENQRADAQNGTRRIAAIVTDRRTLLSREGARGRRKCAR
jgi:hypothetical protein